MPLFLFQQIGCRQLSLGAFTEISFMYHDEYLLDFINTEELNLNDPQDLNEQERKNGENPSIGILLCKEANF